MPDWQRLSRSEPLATGDYRFHVRIESSAYVRNAGMGLDRPVTVHAIERILAEHFGEDVEIIEGFRAP